MKQSTVSTPTSVTLFRTVLVAALAALLGAQAAAQSTSARPDRGITPGASYSVSDLDSVNLSNGNLSLSIQLASLPPMAGGKLSLGISAVYNSKLWDVTRNGEPGTFVIDTPQVSDIGGWRVGKVGYGLRFRNAREDFSYATPSQTQEPTEWALLNGVNYYKVVLTTPDGAEHDLLPFSATGWYNGTRDYLHGYCSTTPTTSGQAMRYYTNDGSFLAANINPPGDPVRWTLFAPDGTQVVEYADGAQRIKDANGNSVKIYKDAGGTLHCVDEQTQREIKMSFDSSANGGQGQYQVWYQSVGGVWQHVDVNMGTTHVRGVIYDRRGLNPNAVEGSECIFQAELGNFLPVVREIVFPQTQPGQPGRRFTFSYNSDATVQATDDVHWGCATQQESYTRTASAGVGELSRVVTPSGAIIDYTYRGDGPQAGPTHFTDPDDIARRVIEAKAVTHDGVTDAWDYVIGIGNTSSVTAPDGSVTTERTYSRDPAFPRMRAGNNGKGGLTYRSASGDRVVERHWTLMPFSGGYELSTGSVLDKVPFNAVVDAEYTTILNAQGVAARMSAKTFRHDFNGNVTEVKEYDWFDPALVSRDEDGVPTGVPTTGATLLRTTATSYHSSADAADSTNVYAKRQLTTGTPSVIDAAQETTAGASVIRVSYDGLDFGVAPTAGNVTQVSRFDDQGDTNTANDRWVTASSTYGQYGNLSTTTDGNGNLTQFFYDDATHALPTKVVVDPLNGTGAQTTLTAYDFSTGLVTSSTDANLQTTTIDYTNQLLNTVDPFGRPGVVTGPAVTADGVSQRRKVFTTYEDSLRRVTVESDLRAEGDRLLKSRTTSDEMGRGVLTEQSEDGSTYTVSARSAYEQGGRVTFTSNPMRAAAAATDGWARVTRDTAGRVSEVATFAGAARPTADAVCEAPAGCTGKMTTAYDAEFVTVTDQAGRVRRSRTDALDRLVRVDEPSGEPTAQDDKLGGYDSPAQPTAYSYDTLGNLTQVRQGGQLQLQNGQYQYVGGQTRTFTYGSLSRLSSAQTPESGRVSYEYDPAGNLKKKIDPRLLADGATHYTTTYEYDGLNRVTAQVYNNGTPDVTYSYDQEYTDHLNVAHAVGNAKGRLTQVRSSVSAYNYTGYDALGRVTGSEQVMPNADGTYTPYTMPEYKYDLAGNLVSEQYPSGRVVKLEYDAAGRVAGVKNQATGLYYAGGVLTQGADNRIRYTASGAPSAVRLGNGLWEHTDYNSRLQPTQLGLGASAADSGKLRLDYTYGEVVNGLLDPKRNNGSVQSQRIYVAGSLDLTQTYLYDEVNRLKTAEEKAGTTSTWKQVYTYDQYGNRNFASGTTYPNYSQSLTDPVGNPVIDPANNRIKTSIPGQGNYIYDEAGNLTRTLITAQTYHDLAYDAENRQVKADGGAAVGGADYVYDGDGRRVKRVAGAIATVCVYDAFGRLVAEYSQQIEGNGTRYVTQDHLGSTRVVTDGGGQPKSRHDYLPFGEEIKTDVVTNSGGRAGIAQYNLGSIRQKFTGYERDAETGLDFAKARYYGSSVGRFNTPDPYNIVLETQAETESDPAKAQANLRNYLEEPQLWNRYVYVSNNPLKYVDPTGELLELIGSEDDIKAGFERIKQLVGSKAAPLLYLRREKGHTYVDYHGSRGDNWKNPDALLAADPAGINVYLIKIINDKNPDNTVEFKVATSYESKYGKFSVEYYGGAVTVGKEESLNGHAQIYVHPDAGNVTQMKVGSTLRGMQSSSNGRQLDFYNDIDDAHEFGHAYANVYDRLPIHGSQATDPRSLEFENTIRARRKLSNRRITH